ncbi:MAG: hypothetical protein ACYCSN_04865 [Acidobacteriaceae bacterium]
MKAATEDASLEYAGFEEGTSVPFLPALALVRSSGCHSAAKQNLLLTLPLLSA